MSATHDPSYEVRRALSFWASRLNEEQRSLAIEWWVPFLVVPVEKLEALRNHLVGALQKISVGQHGEECGIAWGARHGRCRCDVGVAKEVIAKLEEKP